MWRDNEALRSHRDRQDWTRGESGAAWTETGHVFATSVGTELDATNVRRGFRQVSRAAGLSAADRTPREPRHSFVSLLSSGGVSIEDIADLCGHSGTSVTERVYRHQLRPGTVTAARADETPAAPIAGSGDIGGSFVVTGATTGTHR